MLLFVVAFLFAEVETRSEVGRLFPGERIICKYLERQGVEADALRGKEREPRTMITETMDKGNNSSRGTVRLLSTVSEPKNHQINQSAANRDDDTRRDE